MFFTQEDYRKIEKWLLANSVKDTEFAGASLPLKGNETVAFVQDGKNVNVLLKDLIEQIFLLGVSDFLNVTDKYGESRISLTQAIQLIPYKSRKIGQVITFLDEDGEWKLFQFQGERVNQWNNATLWVDLIERIQGISIIDSEDITATVDNLNQTSLTFADKNYNTTDYSGLGRVYLRKNIQTVVNPNTGITYSTNFLTQAMLSKENTIYIIQYDYNLNGQTITIPSGCVLLFEGGSISNGIIIFNNTYLTGNIKLGTSILGTVSNKSLHSSYIMEEIYIKDATIPLNELVKVCSDSKAVLYIDAGNYVLKSCNNNDECIRLWDNTTIIGEGIDNTILTISPTLYSNLYVKVFSSTTDSVNNILIKDLTLDCNGRNNPNGSKLVNIYSYFFLLNLDYAENIIVDSCKIYDNPGRQSIRIGRNEAHSCKNIEVKNCIFLVTGNDSSGGENQGDHSSIYINADTVKIINNRFINNRLLDSTSIFSACSAIELHSDNILCQNNYVENFKTGVNVVATVASHRNAIYSNNIFKRVSCGFDIWTAGNNVMKDILINNNIIQKTTGNNAPIYIRSVNTDVESLTISGNDISILDIPLTSDLQYLPVISSPFKIPANININITNNNFHDYPSGILKINNDSSIDRHSTIVFKDNTINRCGRLDSSSEYSNIAVALYELNGDNFIFNNNTFINVNNNFRALHYYYSYFNYISCCNNTKYDGAFITSRANPDKGFMSKNMIFKDNNINSNELIQLSASSITSTNIKKYDITIKTGDGNFPASINQLTFGATPPTIGTHERGSVVWNTTSDQRNSCVGWVCTVRGTPGIWRPFGRVYASDKYVGITNDRPILDAYDQNFQYYDTTIETLIYWDGECWRNIGGTLPDKVVIV